MLSFSRKISLCQPFFYYIAQVLTMCLQCALASWAPAMGSPCALASWAMGISCQPSWISSFYIFWCIQFEVDLGAPNQGKLSLIPINIPIFPQATMVNCKYIKSFLKYMGFGFKTLCLFNQGLF